MQTSMLLPSLLRDGGGGEPTSPSAAAVVEGFVLRGTMAGVLQCHKRKVPREETMENEYQGSVMEETVG